MKHAIVDGQRREAISGLSGTCQICDVVMTPRCGRFRAAHWSHPPGSVDHRWEPETEWHRNWKKRFPRECQEIVHHARNGERHIADVKTPHGRVLEFQHSPISEQERCAREEIYGQRMCWVANGQRLKWDRRQFFGALRCAIVRRENPLTLMAPAEKCVLLQKWAWSRVPVFFDFGEIEDEGDIYRFGAPVLWASFPRRQGDKAVLKPVYRNAFLDAVTDEKPLRGIDFSEAFERARQHAVTRLVALAPHPRKPRPMSFNQYLARQRRARARRRI